MRSLHKLAFCIYQNHKAKHYVDLVHILANRVCQENTKLFKCPILWEMAILWLDMFCKLMLEKFSILVHAVIKCNWI